MLALQALSELYRKISMLLSVGLVYWSPLDGLTTVSDWLETPQYCIWKQLLGVCMKLAHQRVLQIELPLPEDTKGAAIVVKNFLSSKLPPLAGWV